MHSQGMKSSKGCIFTSKCTNTSICFILLLAAYPLSQQFT